MAYYTKDLVKFKNGDTVKAVDEARYLGCMLNDEANAAKEINRRKADTYATWKILFEFWRHGNSEIRDKLVVYDAVIRAKLMYGLESLQLNKEWTEKWYGKLDTFQLKGLRQILTLPTTRAQMIQGRTKDNTNERVYMIANVEVNKWEARHKGNGQFRKLKEIKPLSQYYKEKRREAIVDIINADPEDPRKAITTGIYIRRK